jgi:hypothetical protein
LYLQHLGYLEDVDVLVDVEVALLDQQHTATGEHFRRPLQLQTHIPLHTLLQNHEPQCVVAGKTGHVLTVPLLLQLGLKPLLLHVQEHPEISQVPLKGRYLLLAHRTQGLIHLINDTFKKGSAQLKI